MHLLPRIYFISLDSVELQGTQSKRKLQYEKVTHNPNIT